MADNKADTLIEHIEALRRTLLWIIAITVVVYPVAYALSPYAIRLLVQWCFPPEMGKLHYFSPMEVFWVQLKLAFVLSLVIAYPWNVWQLWRFLLPALDKNERRAVGWGILFSTTLFLAGIAFCVWLILPLMMRFATGFASTELQPIIGLGSFHTP